MTKKNSSNNQGSGGSRKGQEGTATQQRPVKPSDSGRKSIYNDNGGRKSSDTTNSGGPRERG